jgi:hypothetical protein
MVDTARVARDLEAKGIARPQAEAFAQELFTFRRQGDAYDALEGMERLVNGGYTPAQARVLADTLRNLSGPGRDLLQHVSRPMHWQLLIAGAALSAAGAAYMFAILRLAQ